VFLAPASDRSPSRHSCASSRRLYLVAASSYAWFLLYVGKLLLQQYNLGFGFERIGVADVSFGHDHVRRWSLSACDGLNRSGELKWRKEFRGGGRGR
jgi:hypothetical protein